jgi:hypothetical protein
MAMARGTAECAHCGVQIVDPTSRVVHGDQTFCCANCSAAMEETGSGSDRRTLRHEGDLRCAHCAAPIVDESTMESRGDQAFCCANCATAVVRS